MEQREFGGSNMAKPSDNLFLHADGDAFFVACELTKRPDLKGKPVIVGVDRGIAVAMSPEAKRLGVTRGMPVFQIKKLCPSVVILPHHFDLYRDISERMHEILFSYAKRVEVYSIDECFALVTPPEIKYFSTPEKFMSELKREIEGSLGVTYSLGLARTKTLAKQASKLEKPAGVVMLLDKVDETRALKKTPIEDIWGIGRQTIPKLARLGMKTAYDFVKFDPSLTLPKGEGTTPLPLEGVRGRSARFSRPLFELQRELSGESIWDVEDNIDPRDQKSIQCTETFRPASTDPKIIWKELAKNAEGACEEARALRLLSNKVSYFVKSSEFKYRTAEVKLPFYTSDPGLVLSAIEPNFPRLLKKNERIRSTGVILHNLIREEKAPRDLFGAQDKALKRTRVEEVADQIREKYGHDTIKKAASLKKK